jgi:NAD(P)-dependent dehydrogenase (short-subunit alcohol dehydrogenase family)
MPQRVLVTAGANGIGLAIARAFATEGARVHIADISPEGVDAATSQNISVSGSVTDVSKPESLDRLFDDIRKGLGGLDVLVNNAGIAGPTAPVESYDPAA